MSEINSRHPEITYEIREEWALMRHTMAGERVVKAEKEVYLPKPSGFKSMADDGKAAYEAYRKRATFPEIVAPSIAAMVGIVHAKETQIEMPDGMAPIWEDADGDGMPLEAFHRLITRHLLWLGRFGVLADAPVDGGEPFMTGYSAETIINWDHDWYVLDETFWRRTGFAWERVHRYRVLELIDGRYVSSLFEGSDAVPVEVTTPTVRGGGALSFIPFAVGNARNVKPDVETPPLIGVANAALAMYQLSADYRHQLFMSGQETLVAINGPAPAYVGAGVVHQMNGDRELPPDLKYVSPTCAGIEAHRMAMLEQQKSAVMAGARLFEAERSQESGEARRLRFASETSNLMSVAMVSAGLLERGLRDIAQMKGLNPDDVVVKPPADLLDTTMTPQELQALFGVYVQGGMSWDTYFANAQRGGLMSAERTAEEEFAQIDFAQPSEDNVL